MVSFGTSFNDSRAEDIGGVEKALQEANPDWSVRRAFTAQIIINHVQARDGEKIDNENQAFVRKPSKQYDQLLVIWEFISLYQTIGRFPGFRPLYHSCGVEA